MARLGLVPFDGPLVAFDPAPEGAPSGPIYLGGDLHQIHPATTPKRTKRRRDESLDAAMITFGERGGESLEVTAVHGVWCLALPDEPINSAPYFVLWDMKGRIRTWLLLPPARLMMGLAHLWLPSVPSPPGFI
jgi:hypothetical protein